MRPYCKLHEVGLHESRGANAGDFAGINVIDLLLGLCRADAERDDIPARYREVRKNRTALD